MNAIQKSLAVASFAAVGLLAAGGAQAHGPTIDLRIGNVRIAAPLIPPLLLPPVPTIVVDEPRPVYVAPAPRFYPAPVGYYAYGNRWDRRDWRHDSRGDRHGWGDHDRGGHDHGHDRGHR